MSCILLRTACEADLGTLCVLFCMWRQRGWRRGRDDPVLFFKVYILFLAAVLTRYSGNVWYSTTGPQLVRNAPCNQVLVGM